MINFALFKKEPEKKHFLILDIGTEAIKTLVFQKQGEKITVSGVSREYFDEFSVWESRDFSKDIIKKTILKALGGLLQEKIAAIKTLPILLTLPANILKGRIVLEEFLRENSKEDIKKEERETIIKKVLENARKDVSRQNASQTGILPQEIEFLELKILEKKIDGYEVPDIQGYSGRKLEFRILATFILRWHLEIFRQILSFLGLNILKIIHQSEALSGISLASSALFVDVGGDLTQFSIVKNGKLQIVDEFGIGSRIFNQELSEKLGLQEIEARAFKDDYINGVLSEGVRKKVREIFLRVSQTWIAKLKEKLSEKKILVPSHIFLLGEGILLPEIQEAIENNFPESRIEIIHFKDLKNIEIQDKKSILIGPENIPTLLLCYLVENDQ